VRAPNPDEKRPVRVWDLPTRLFHWLIVALFGFSWWTIENDHLDWHKLSGYGILTLVLFRVYWGVFGSTTARFADFIHTPRSVAAYFASLIRRSGRVVFGHNPMGGWSVLMLLFLLLVQSVLGLFAVDIDGLDPGPLGNFVSFETGRRVAHWHGRVFNLLLLLSTLHIAVVLFYLFFKRQNLIAAMIIGTKRVGTGIVPPPLRFVPWWWALPGLAGAGGIVAWIVFGRF
jgi:cytochrome b